MMKRNYRGIFLLALGVLSSPLMQAQPRIAVIGGEVVDWGSVPPSVLKQDVKVTNTGTDTLALTVHLGCGCTMAPLDKDRVGPGDTATLKVSLDLRDRTGEQKRGFRILSNDPRQDSVHILLKALILRDVLPQPPQFEFIRYAEPGKEYSVETDLLNNSSEQLTVETPAPMLSDSIEIRFELSGEHLLKPGERRTLTARVKPLRRGLMTDRVIVHTSGKNTSEVMIPIMCHAAPVKPDEPQEQ